MRKNNKNLEIMTMIFCIVLVIANVVTGKVIDTGLTLNGEKITIAGAIVCYPITYLITDIVGEMWGKKEASNLVKIGFISQIIATLIIFITTYTPSIDSSMQAAYIKLLGQNWIFVLGSLLAYWISQNIDVFIFHTLRNKYVLKHGSNKHRWIWNNVSTVSSQLVDTIIFIIIAFGIGFGWLFSNPLALINMIIGQYLVKFIISLLDTPIFYLFTNRRGK